MGRDGSTRAALPQERSQGIGLRTHPSAARKRNASALEFNHAMIYTNGLARALTFYRDVLGFEVIDSFPGAYARLKSPGGATTIALHTVEAGRAPMDASCEGIRLYFEVEALVPFCRALEKKGVKFDQLPKDMPWGWKHAYLRDPDGHEISLYWAGKARFRKTVVGNEAQRSRSRERAFARSRRAST